jgi:hypothetical protein
MTNDPAGERILRAKYLDWCSARVADRFLELTPDQIYELAHWRSGDGGEQSSPPLGSGEVSPTLSSASMESLSLSAAESPASPAALSYPAGAAAEGGAVYLALVEKVAEVLAARLRLPPFEEWAIAYRTAPERFDAELLGLWRGELRPSATEP